MQKITLIPEKLDFRANEAYRTLRTNVEYSGDSIKVIAVTSCLPGEGKSTTSFELAKAFAQQGKKTLLIDADLRKSVMSRISDSAPVKLGLTSFLVGKEKVMDVLTETDQRNLFIIFAGYVPPNPSELLSGHSFKSLLDAARKSFDMVIIDTPPVGSAIDGVVVAKQCDGVVVVIKHASISYKLAKSVKQQLDSVGCKVLGAVLNQVGAGSTGFYGSYYNKYYGSGYYGYGCYGKKYGKSYDNYYGSESPDFNDLENAAVFDTEVKPKAEAAEEKKDTPVEQ